MISRWQINITYKCNLHCKWCLQFLETLSWPDSYITDNDIKIASEKVKRQGINIGLLRVSGGEPLMHPDFEKICLLVKDLFGHTKFIVCTNTVIKAPKMEGIGYRRSPPGWKEPRHEPCMISPADLGIEPILGFKLGCSVISRCGRLFDTYGFAPCGNAGCIGRIVGIDPYDVNPVLFGKKEMCKHCIFSLHMPMRRELWDKARSGEIEYPTKAYREGIKRQLNNPTTFKLFSDRCKEERK